MSRCDWCGRVVQCSESDDVLAFINAAIALRMSGARLDLGNETDTSPDDCGRHDAGGEA